jgi:hypothetical protein
MVGRAAALAAAGIRVTRRVVVTRIVAALLLTGCAALLLLLARDVWHWGRAMHDADARAAVRPIGADAWSADTALPGGFVRGVLGIDDDIAFRQAVMGAIDLIHRHGSHSGNQHVLVETALARVVLTDSSHTRASIAADYLGVLLYSDRNSPQRAISPYYNPKNPGSTSQSPEQKAIAEFEAAVRLDPNDADAKKNLEVLMHQSKPQSQKGQPKPGTGDKVGSKGSGQQRPGFGY